MAPGTNQMIATFTTTYSAVVLLAAVFYRRRKLFFFSWKTHQAICAKWFKTAGTYCIPGMFYC
jgi:hypothetical protein